MTAQEISCPKRALFPLGEVTATYNALRKIPRLELFAALRSHSIGEGADSSSMEQLRSGFHRQANIKSIHLSRSVGKVFICTSLEKGQTLVWLDEDKGSTINEEILD
jgi:hypothetical protein